MLFRRFIGAAALALALAGCGSGTDFTVHLTATKGEVKAELNQLSPNILTGSVGVTPVRSEWVDADTLRYILPGKGSSAPGELTFTLSEGRGGKTDVAVALDIPRVTRKAAGGEEVLVESKMEDMLKRMMRDWGEAHEAGRSTYQGRAGISTAISVFAISIQRFDDFENAAESALVDSYMAGLYGDGPDEGWGWSDEEMVAEDSFEDPYAAAEAETDFEEDAFDPYAQADDDWSDAGY
ncbi:MAG: hypothetical protein V2J14_07300 [Erythrobacter sp.]|jgi:hypothetical protein|nr:hypothetical protein [Erythrobacter sp.]